MLAHYAFIALLALAPTEPAPGPVSRDRMLVSTNWLAQHLHDADLVLLQVGDPAEYEREHIPGARFLSLRAISDRPANGLALEMLPAHQLDSALAALGISNTSRVVLYFGSDWISPTTRAWLTLQYAGLGERAVILDGGLPAWKVAKLPVTAEVPTAPPATVYSSALNPGWIVDAAWLQAHLADRNLRIIDARDPQFYQGLDAGSGTRPGHLPGARSIPFFTVTDTAGRFLPDSALRRLFREAGVTQDNDVVAYCHIGQQATAIVFAARLLGYRARLYDGSFQDWSKREDTQVVGGVPNTVGKLITPAELESRIAANSVTVVDLRSDLNAYLTDHVPGAVYLHYENLRVSSAGVPAGNLSQTSYADILSRIGVRRDKPVVIYAGGDEQNFDATYLAWLLAGFRQPEVFVLEGGYTRWTAEGHARARDYPEYATVKYSQDPYLLDVIEGEHVRHMVGNSGVVILDVRSPEQYAGTSGSQVRRGHIPGAINHFWHDDLVTAGSTTTWKPLDELRASYVAQGITPDKYVIVYCNTGRQATHTWFALKVLLGYPDVAVYVPSFTEWSEKADWPVEVASATSP